MATLAGKTLFITGASRGIGLAIALRAARDGANVAIAAKSSVPNPKLPGTIHTAAEAVTAAGGQGLALKCDIREEEQVHAAVAATVDTFGGIDILVNNASAIWLRGTLDTPMKRFDLMQQVNARGTFLCSQEAALRMKAQGTGGSIVNTVSAAHFGNFGQTNYAGSKGAIASMTYTWAGELARAGIRVNAISPLGTTRMSATAKVGGKDVDLPFFDPTLNGPFVAWLCSDDAAWVTGQIFGTGGDRVMIVEQPRYATGMFKPDGWSVEDLAKNMKSVFGTRLEPFGLMKPPYAYYGGVKVEKAE